MSNYGQRKNNTNLKLILSLDGGRLYTPINVVQETTLFKNLNQSKAVLNLIWMISTIEKFCISNFLAYPPNSPPKNLLPYRRSFFQIHFFTILISESDSLQKSVCTKYLSFFDTIMGTGSKMQKTGKLEGKFKKVR